MTWPIWTLLIIAAAACAAWWKIRSRSHSRQEKAETYVCSVCGEKHCTCYREDAASSDRGGK